MEELIWSHIEDPYEAAELIEAIETLPNFYKEYYNNSHPIGIIVYFPLYMGMYDIIVPIHKDNKFTLSMARDLATYIKNRNNTIKIAIIGNNNKLERWARLYGGYLEGDTLVFPK